MSARPLNNMEDKKEIKDEETAFAFDSQTEPLTHRVTVKTSDIPKKYEYVFYSNKSKTVWFEDKDEYVIAEIPITSYEADLW